MHRRREAAIGDVISAAQQRQRVVNRGGEASHPENNSDQQNPLPTEGEGLCGPVMARDPISTRRNLVRRPSRHHPRCMHCSERRIGLSLVTSPTSAAKSATGPPCFPVNTHTSAVSWSGLARSSI